MNKSSQINRILSYLKKYKTITAKEALENIAVERLASRIHDMKERGIPVQDKFVNGVNRFGEPTRYKIYWIEEEENNYGND